MAKPLSVASLDASSSSSSSKYTPHRPQTKAEPSQRRWHRSPTQPLSTVGPSSGILSLLASIVSASTVHANPIPPSFLCPFIDSSGDRNCTFIEAASTPRHPLSGATKIHVPRHVPDRFSKEADGIWRRVGSYTLYGSTMPTCASGSCSQPTAVPSSVDDQIQVPDSLDTTTVSSSSTKLNMEDLPPGWKPIPKVTAGRTTLILALSLVLAFFICLFIIGCLFWRKNIKKKRRSKDLEDAKLAKKRNGNESERVDGGIEKEIKTKQKLWAKATARWKANVRHSARQRRGKRISRMVQGHQSSASFDNSRSHLAGSASSSRASSRRSSMVSIRDPPQCEQSLHTVTSATSQEERPQNVLPSTETPVLPPAYQHRGQIPPIVVSPDDMSTNAYSGFMTPSRTDRSRRPSHSSINASSSINGAGQNSSPSSSLNSAHVATDDKSLLARLAELASAPPVDVSQDSSGLPGSVHVSVPAWQDEDVGDFEMLIAPNNLCANGEPSSSMFPPPPSKERLATAEFYDYTYAFDEMGPPELEGEPSAPPFEEGQAPPLEIAPSAPLLLDENELLVDSHASAPEWDSVFPLDPREEIASGQDHDRIPISSSSPQAPSSSAITSTVRDSIITLPGYRP